MRRGNRRRASPASGASSPRSTDSGLIDAERVLLTHGPPVLRDGRRALADALAGEPWYHRSS